MTNNDLISTFIEVKLAERNDFLKIMETLERVGIASRRDNTLYQSCHILHKQTRYYIVHFKEMFALDGKETDFSEEDKARRNRIASLLEQWIPGCKIVSPPEMLQPMAAMNHIKVIAYKDRPNWKLVSKYSMGGKKKINDT